MMMTGQAAESTVAQVGAGVTREYLCPARDQMFLMPINMRDWVDPGHLALFVIDVIGELDTRALHSRPGWCPGRRPYQPEMMVALLLYAYCCGIRSSRLIEASCRTDAAFRVICGGLMPDHATIARFVVDHEQALEGLFVEGVRLCAAAGLADLSVVALDGTKIAANASLARNRNAEWIRHEVTQLMAVTAQDDEQPAASTSNDGVQQLAGLEQPVAELGTRTGRRARLRAALAVIETEIADRVEHAAEATQAAAERAKQGRRKNGRLHRKDPFVVLASAEIDHDVALERLERMQAERAAKHDAAARGEKLKAPPPCRIRAATETLARCQDRLHAARDAVEKATNKVRANTTDPDSRIMSTRNDGWIQGYNAQAIVNPRRIVLTCDVCQDAGDFQQYQPMTEQLTDTLTNAGITTEPELILADAGYCSEHNLTIPGPDRLIATQASHNQRQAARELGSANGPPPPNLGEIDAMEHLLRTPQGTAAYAQRFWMIEPIFGDRKHNRQIRRFRRRGLDAVRSEWAFIHLAGNIRTLYHHRASAAA